MNRHTRLLGRMAAITGLMGVLASGIVGCEEDANRQTEQQQPYYPTREAKPGEYPTADTDIFFSENYAGLGSFPLMMWDAGWLTNNPAFQVYRGHAGGYGDTLEIISQENGIFYRWAYNDLMDISVSGNWRGKVFETGIKLGDSREAFRQAYPDARQGINSYYGYGDECWKASVSNRWSRSNIIADINEEGNIKRLRLDPSWQDDFNYYGP